MKQNANADASASAGAISTRNKIKLMKLMKFIPKMKKKLYKRLL